MSESESKKKAKKHIARTSIGIDEDVLAEIDRLAILEKTNRTTVINQILSVICTSSVSQDFEAKKEMLDLNTAQMLKKTIELYLELTDSPQIEKLASKTFRHPEQMVRHLVNKGIRLYEDL